MSPEKIIEMVTEMRRLQRSYFAGNKGCLSQAKKMEHKVDEAIALYNDKKPKLTQQNLFSNGSK